MSAGLPVMLEALRCRNSVGSESFTQIIPPLLHLLGDDAKPVRSRCPKGLKIMGYMLHATEYDLLLELLEEGLDFEDCRVRETNATAASEKRITECLGEERRNEVFRVRYMARSDCEHPVKPRANITWKGLVYNSSKMLKGILDTLMHELITTLSIKNRECQLSSSKWLGNLVQNAGHFILPKIVPVLLEGMERDIDAQNDDDCA